MKFDKQKFVIVLCTLTNYSYFVICRPKIRASANSRRQRSLKGWQQQRFAKEQGRFTSNGQDPQGQKGTVPEISSKLNMPGQNNCKEYRFVNTKNNLKTDRNLWLISLAISKEATYNHLWLVSAWLPLVNMVHERPTHGGAWPSLGLPCSWKGSSPQPPPVNL